MPPRKQAAGQVIDLLKQCGVDGWPRSDAERLGDVSVAVVSKRDLLAPNVSAVSGLPCDLEKVQAEIHKVQIRLNCFAGPYLGEAAAGGGRPCSSDAGGGSPYQRLRSLKLCANMSVRGAFTSDVVFDWPTLPQDLAFSAAFDSTQARTLWVPAPPATGSAHVAAPQPTRPPSPGPGVASGPPRPHRRSRRPRQPAEEAATEPQEQQLALQPSPIAQLERVAAFSGRYPGLLHWVPSCSHDGSQEVVWAAGSLIVLMELACDGTALQQQGRQRFLRGHTRAVKALALSADGRWLASAEEGAGAEVRLWSLQEGRCLATVPGKRFVVISSLSLCWTC